MEAAAAREEVLKLHLRDKLPVTELIVKLLSGLNENHAFLQHYYLRHPQVKKRHGRPVKGELLFKLEINLRLAIYQKSKEYKMLTELLINHPDQILGNDLWVLKNINFSNDQSLAQLIIIRVQNLNVMERNCLLLSSQSS